MRNLDLILSSSSDDSYSSSTKSRIPLVSNGKMIPSFSKASSLLGSEISGQIRLKFMEYNKFVVAFAPFPV